MTGAFQVACAASRDEIAAAISHCEATRTKFVDAQFPADNSSIAKPPFKAPDWVKKVKLQWERPREGSTLFMNGVEPGDIVQGALGDCWLVIFPVDTTHTVAFLQVPECC